MKVTLIRPEMFFALTVSFALLVFGRAGKALACLQAKRKDAKAVGLELSTTGIGIYSTIIVAYPRLIPDFWKDSTLIQFTNSIIIQIFLLQVVLWTGTIIFTNKLLRTPWRDIKRIERYTWTTNVLGFFSVCICFFLIFFARITP